MQMRAEFLKMGFRNSARIRMACYRFKGDPPWGVPKKLITSTGTNFARKIPGARKIPVTYLHIYFFFFHLSRLRNNVK